MNIVETKLPIPIEDLKKYFQDKETYFVVDLKNSELPNDKIFTYLSNLNVPCDIINPDYDLLKEYFITKSLVDIPTLEKMAISVLLTLKGLEKVEEHYEFINNNKEILNKWESILDSLVLYNVYTLQLEETSAHVESYPLDDTDDITGINFLGLLKHEDFFYYFNGAKQENVKFYKKYFNDYMFKGNNLFTYWANENNPMFLLTDAIASGTMDKNKYYEAVEKDMETINV